MAARRRGRAPCGSRPMRACGSRPLFESPKRIRGDFYLVAIPPDLRGGRVNWFDRAGRPGSRGHWLLPA